MTQPSLEELESSLTHHFFDLQLLSDELRSATPCDHRDSPATKCPICWELLTSEDAVLIKCGHMYHRHCIDALPETRCPYCRTEFETHELTRVMNGIHDGHTPTTTQGKDGGCDMAQFADNVCRLSHKLVNATNGGDLSELKQYTHTCETLRRRVWKLQTVCALAFVCILLCIVEVGYYSRADTGTSERRDVGVIKLLNPLLEVIRTTQKRRTAESGKKDQDVKEWASLKQKELVLQGVVNMITKAIHGLLTGFAWTMEKTLRLAMWLLMALFKSLWTLFVYLLCAVCDGVIYAITRFIWLSSWVFRTLKKVLAHLLCAVRDSVIFAITRFIWLPLWLFRTLKKVCYMRLSVPAPVVAIIVMMVVAVCNKTRGY